MNKAVILGFVRHLFTYGGGILTSKGVVGASEAEAIIGGSVALVGLIWSFFDKKGR